MYFEESVGEAAEQRLSGLVMPLRRALPGRIRVRVEGLYRSEAMRSHLERVPRGVSNLRVVSANPLTGSALVLFDPQRSAREVVGELERWAGALLSSEHPTLSTSVHAVPPERSTARRKRRARPEATFTAAPESSPRETWHTKAAEETLVHFASTEHGLPARVAAERLDRYGPNQLGAMQRRSPVAMFLEQFANPPVALLGMSAVVSVATGGVADAVVIVGVVLINAVIGYVTEAQAEKTIDALSNIGPSHATVLRDGDHRSISIGEVVPGDVLVLSPGTYVAADARLLSSNQLSVDESALTGESLPVGKHHDFIGSAETPMGDRRNMLHRGTVVTGGSGLAVAVATGARTEIGVIQSLVGEVRTPDTPLQKQLDDMGMQLAIISGGICALVFGIGVLRGIPMLEMLKSAISLAVAAVPEGLPTVATTTLALGIRQMQRQKVLIRHLPAVESLGSVQTLCFDKTGTLTENRMRAVAVMTPEHVVELSSSGEFTLDGSPIRPSEREPLLRLMEVVTLCSEVTFHGDVGPPELEGSPTEKALVEIALLAGEDVRALRQRYPTVKTIHRAEGRLFMVTVHLDEDRKPEHLIAVKGSPAEVLALCSDYANGGGRVALDDERRSAILEQNELMAGQALRVLGVAIGHSVRTSTAAVTKGLTWLGLVGMEDTIRPGMEELIDRFQEAGIETVMITGDQSATAFSVGQRLGLNHRKPLEIVDSTSLDKLEPEVLRAIVRDTTVFARVSPAHKLRIVQALQDAGLVVAMTGDGVNDGPALKAADVGVALGERGTEVARSVADVVLEDDNLHTMIIAVEQGRTIYRNIRKSLHYLLSSNLSEIEIMLVTTAIGAGEALNPIQLLWINLITDIMPALGLSMEPPESDVLKEPPRDPKEPILRRSDSLRLLRESLAISAGTLGVYGLSLARYGIGPRASTNCFMTLTLAQLLHAISCRSEKTSVLNARDGNRILATGIGASFALQILAAFVPPLRTLLHLTPVAAADWLAIAAGATLPFVANEAVKHLPSPPTADHET